MTASPGYLVFLIRMNEPRRTAHLQRLSAFGEKKELDLLDLAQKSLATIQDQYFRENGSAEGYRLRQAKSQGRTLFIQVNKGPHSVGGEAYETTTGASVDVPNTTAMLNRMRGMLAIPKDSYYGLLFAERQGNRNLKEIIRGQSLLPNAVLNNMTIHVDAFAESKDWQRLLKDQQALSLTEHLEIVDTTTDGSTARTPIKLVAEGPRVNKITKGVMGAITSRVQRREVILDRMSAAANLEEKKVAQKSAFSVADQTELTQQKKAIRDLQKSPELADDIRDQLRDAVPVHVDGSVHHKRFEVVTGQDRPERTFSVDRNSLPQFVYETSGILSDAALFAAWVAHAEGILRARGVRIPTGWAS